MWEVAGTRGDFMNTGKGHIQVPDKVPDSLDHVHHMVNDGRPRLVTNCITDGTRRGGMGCARPCGLLRGRSGHFQGLVVEYF